MGYKPKHPITCPGCKRTVGMTRDGHNFSRRRGDRVFVPVWRYSRHVTDAGAWCSKGREQVPDDVAPQDEAAA